MSDESQSISNDSAARQLMIIDDEPELLQSLIVLFEKQYLVVFAPSGNKALELLQQGFTPQVILSDNRMPGISGVEFLAQSTQYVPDAVRVIMTGFTDIREILAAINQGHVYMYLSKPWQLPDMMQAIRICFQHYMVSTANKRLVAQMEQKHQLLLKLNDELAKTNQKLEELNHRVYGDLKRTATTLGGLIGSQQRYYYTNHPQACATYVRTLGEMLGLEGDRLEALEVAASLHDLGLVELPGIIQRSRADSLVGSDRALYESHVERGVNLLRKIERFDLVADIVEQHHERVDGSGFPRRLSGLHVHKEAQILGLVDLYHDLVYRMFPAAYLGSRDDVAPTLRAEDLLSRQKAAWTAFQQLTGKFDDEILKAFFDLVASGKFPELKF